MQKSARTFEAFRLSIVPQLTRLLSVGSEDKCNLFRLRLPWVVLLYILLFALVLGANPFRGETVAPVAILSKCSGWATHEFSSPPSHPQRSDALDSLIPRWVSVKDRIRNGENGLWNPMPGGGSPGLAELSRGFLTPSFLAFLLIEPHWLGYYFAVLIKLVLASVGAYLFLRHFTGARAAFFGGMVFALCGFNAAWFHWTHVTTSAWIPWLLWACAGWYLHRLPRWVLANALITAALLLGGFPAVAAYGLYAVALLASLMTLVYTSSWPDAVRAAGLWAAAVAAGFMLAAIPLLALRELLGLLDLSYRHGGTSYLFPKDLMLLVDGFYYGVPRVEQTLYTGLPALVLGMLACVHLRHRPQSDRAAMLVWYGLPLFTISLVVVFGLLPSGLIRAIPAIGSSAWGRLAVIVDLALAILAAVGLDYLLRWTRRCPGTRLRWLVTGLLLLCVGLQFYTQVKLFRTFNTVATAADFFPTTPTLAHVSQTLTPTQSVVADKSYMVSGTLGVYGIAEWFAHGFKTEAEKAMLRRLVDDPFRTPTAALFSASALRPDADLYARLGIRYVLQDSCPGQPVRQQVRSRPRHPAPPLPRNRLTQIVRLDDTISVTAIGIVLATYRAPHAPADAILELRRETGELIARARLDAKKITDNHNAVFPFKTSVEMLPGIYQLQIALSDTSADGLLTAWYTPKASHEGDYLLFNNKVHSGATLYTFYRESEESYPPALWRRHEEANNTIVTFENLLTPKGAYWLPRLDEAAPWSEAFVHTSRPKANVIDIDYTGQDAGFIVVPVRSYPGWVVYVNGVKRQLQTYLDILPAVAVQGAAKIQIVYQPVWLGLGAGFMLAAVFLLIALCRTTVTRRVNKN